MNVGFIGLGRMGAGMAANLLKAGHQVTSIHRTGERPKRWSRKAPGPRQRLRGLWGDAVITMLANDDPVESIVLGDGGVLVSLSAGAVHVSSSTISVALSEKLEKARAKAGKRYIAAPVFGPRRSGGRSTLCRRRRRKGRGGNAAPLFDAIGQKTFVVSSSAKAANLVKLSGNFLIASVIKSLGEAMALIGKGGVDRRLYLEVLTSTLFSAPIYATYGSLIVEGKFEPAGFAALLAIRISDWRSRRPKTCACHCRSQVYFGTAFLPCSPTAATRSAGRPSAGSRPRTPARLN